MYGATYLPRKFKTAFALPPHNDVDIFSQDLGYIAIVEDGELAGYNVTIGGGLGMSHGNAETFPRLADVLGFIPADKVIPIGEAVASSGPWRQCADQDRFYTFSGRGALQPVEPNLIVPALGCALWMQNPLPS